MSEPTPVTATDEILVQIRDELRSLRDDLSQSRRAQVKAQTQRGNGRRREVTGR